MRYAVERKRMQDALVMTALYDQLTGLPSRRLFMTQLDKAVARAQRNGAGLCLAYIDLNGFKPINDMHGHAAGDAVLRAIGGRLGEAVRRTDSVGRLGGDEFVCLLENFRTRDDALAVIDKIAARIGCPVDYEGAQLTVSASIGMAFHPEDGDSAQALMERADSLMYAAKREDAAAGPRIRLSDASA